MKKFLKNEALQKTCLDAAQALNFYGKRLRAKKCEVVEQVQAQFENLKSFEVGDLTNWLEENKPETAKPAAQRASNKKPHDTLDGALTGHTDICNDLAGKQAYIITSAQNNTALSGEFLAALQTYAKVVNAQILVTGFTYNKTGYQTNRDEENDKVYFAPELQDYLVDNKPYRLFDNLVFAAEVDILPTATRPTNGHAGYHGDNSLILGHSKVELQSLPTAQHETPKFIYTTGCITVKNYRQQRAGQRAEKNHSIAALFVEQNSNCETGWQVRQLHWNGTSFYDLDAKVTSTEVLQAEPATAFTFGDIHSEKGDPLALADAIDVCNLVKAKNVFLHDLHDFSSRNHHNRGDHLFIASQGSRTIQDDLQVTADTLNQICEETTDSKKVFVVRSNHDEALDRWLVDKKYDFRNDPLNARLYLDLQSQAYSYIEQGSKVPEMLDIALDVCGLDVSEKAEFLTRKCNVKIQGVILSEHGDCGANGSRATPQQLAKTYNKITSGHTHTVSIFDGCYTAGVTGSKQMGYNERGASSWSHGHVIQYADGNRAVVVI